jgi:hypothetical protein
VEMLNKMIEYKHPDSWRKRASRSWKADLDSVREKINRFGEYLQAKENSIFKDLK